LDILICTQYFWPENFRINDLACALTSRGHRVTVLTGIPNYPQGRVFEAYRSKPDSFRRFNGIDVVRVPMLPRGSGAFRLFLNYSSFAVSASIFGLIRLRRKPFDVVFVYEPSPVTVGLPAVLIGRVKDAPVVFWALDLWPDSLAAVGAIKSPRVLRWVGHVVRFIYKRCALVLGQSKSFLSHIGNYCSDPSKVRYFPSWAEEVFESTHVEPASEVELRRDLFSVVFAGNIGEAQDMPAVLDAVEALPDDAPIRWLIVGDGRKSEWLHSEVERRKLTDRVLLLGRFPVERMLSFYVHGDALLVSLKQDPVFSMTIPGKVQSYLMAGLPLLGMLDGEGAAVIQEANAGLTCPAGDSKGLARAVLALSAMPLKERQALGNNGRQYARREFGRELLISRLEAMFMESKAISAKKRVNQCETP